MKNIEQGTAIHVDGHTAAFKTGLAGTGAVASYVTLNEWVAMATLVFVVLQIGLLIPKYWKLYSRWREGKNVEVKID